MAVVNNICIDCGIDFLKISHNKVRCNKCQRKQRSKTQTISHRYYNHIKTCKHCRMRVDCPLQETGHHHCQFHIPAEEKDYFVNDVDWFPIMSQAGVFRLFTPDEIRSDKY